MRPLLPQVIRERFRGQGKRTLSPLMAVNAERHMRITSRLWHYTLVRRDVARLR